MPQVLISIQAEEDLYAIWHYIAIDQQSPLNANRFIARFDNTFKSLAQTPLVGTSKDIYSKGLYQFPFGDYLIFYFVRDNGIEIVRVLHGARYLPDLF